MTESLNTCPQCGTQLQTAHQGFNPEGDDDIAHREMSEVVAVDFCPNPDCPTGEIENPTAQV